ncbi:unnamed protein product, partial [Pylaiella littoralis]
RTAISQPSTYALCTPSYVVSAVKFLCLRAGYRHAELLLAATGNCYFLLGVAVARDKNCCYTRHAERVPIIQHVQVQNQATHTWGKMISSKVQTIRRSWARGPSCPKCTRAHGFFCRPGGCFGGGQRKAVRLCAKLTCGGHLATAGSERGA